MFQTVDGIQLAANVEFIDGLVEVDDSGVLWVAAKDLLGLLLPVEVLVGCSCHDTAQQSRAHVLVGSVDVVDCDDGQVAVVAEVAQGNPCARLDAKAVYRLLRHVERDGHGEEGAICEAAVGDDAGKRSARACDGWSARGDAHPL